MSDESPRKNACGPCTACCVAKSVPQVPKKAYEPCRHLATPPPDADTALSRRVPLPYAAGGCAIYEGRPHACAEYECLWLHGSLGADERLRPDNLGVVFDTLTGSVFGDCVLAAHEVWEGALESDVAHGIIKLLAEGRIVLVMGRARRQIVGPPGLVFEAARAAMAAREAAAKLTTTGPEEF